ncbi:unnamed protein product [Phaedon cochleariae]|uniref:Uncharacterized protein n=1 Tax=Phaedon cochleariae TaxID=80249 RepID=A0A9N9SEK4_PHACE|nr:unnamed protein product [Phaedon cochleariae]
MANDSDPFPVWKRIYSVINGNSENISPNAVEDTLKLCKEQIIEVLLQFKSYSKESFKSWKSESGLKDILSDDEMCNFIHLLSRELDLDVSVAWTVTCNFLMFEYYGRVDELKTLIKFDSKVEYLTENVWYFYTADRMFLLKTLRHIFESVSDKKHVYYNEFNSFTKSLDFSLLWKNLKAVFKNLLDEIDRDKSQTVSDKLLVQWIHRNNREQAEVAILLLHTFEYLKPDGSELADMLTLFIRHGFTRHPLFHESVTVSRKTDLIEIKNSEISLILTIMKIYWNTPGLAKMLPSDIEKNLELLQIQGDNSIILFAWAALKTSIDECDEKESHMDYCNRVILQLAKKKVFNSLYEFLTHKMFLGTKIGEITAEAVITLMTEFTKICADFNFVQEQPGVSKLTAELLKRKGLVILESLGPIFQLSMEAFPFIFEPFLDMCKALIVIPEKYDSIISLLKNIPGFLSELRWAHHSPSFLLDKTQRLFTDSDLFMVPSGTRVESFPYQGVGYARFIYPFDFFRLMEQFTKSLTTINFEVGTEWHCYDNLVELVIIGFQFINHLLRHYRGDLRKDPALKSLVQRLEIVPTQFVEGPSKNFDFIRLYFEVNCTLIRGELLDFSEVFTPVHRKRMFPVVVSYEKAYNHVLFDQMLNGSLLFRLLKEEEGKDTHCLLVQYLELIEFMVQKNIYHREIQYAGLWYIINCTFPLYQQWKYADPFEETLHHENLLLDIRGSPPETSLQNRRRLCGHLRDAAGCSVAAGNDDLQLHLNLPQGQIPSADFDGAGAELGRRTRFGGNRVHPVALGAALVAAQAQGEIGGEEDYAG